MDYVKIDPRDWNSFFDRVSGILEGKQVQIEVAGLDLGDQIEADWLPLTGITYDGQSDQVEVFTGELEHNIRKPRKVHLEEKDGDIAQVIVIDEEGHKQFLHFRAPLALPRAGW